MISYKSSKNILKKGVIKIKDEKIKSINSLNRVSSSNIYSTINYQTGDTFENSWGNGALSAISGYPHITIPLDFSDNLPTGVSFMGTAWDEVKLLNMAYSFEQYNNFFPKPIQDRN